MIAVFSVPEALAAGLPGRRITPFGASEAQRAYSLVQVPNPPPLALALVFWHDDDSYMIRYFNDVTKAVLWATSDALSRSLV